MVKADIPGYRAKQRKDWMNRIRVEDPVRFAAWMAKRAKQKRDAYAAWKLLGLPAKPRNPRIRAQSERIPYVRKSKAIKPDGVQMNNTGLEWPMFIR